MNTELYIATHKPIKFTLPLIYQWVQVNATRSGQWDGYLHDDDGPESISYKNSSYCELTVLYRIWKESKADIVGLCHYRRFFGQGIIGKLIEKAGIPIKKESIGHFLLKGKTVAHYLRQYDIILASPYHPFPLNVYENLLRFVYPCDIERMILVIRQHSPEYEETLLKVLQSKSISYCNMFVTRRETAIRYCTWLFDVLKEIEKCIDVSSYDPQHTRIYGYLAEVLLNVYVQKNLFTIKTVPLLSLDEDEEPLSFKRRMFVMHNVFITAIGLMPNRWAKQLWKSRFEYQRTGREPINFIQSLSLSSLSDYFSSVGGKNITVIPVPTPYIRSVFDTSTLYAFLCDNMTNMQVLLQVINQIRHLNHPFGAAIIIRIYPTQSLNESAEKSLIKNGFFYSVDGNTPYFFSTL